MKRSLAIIVPYRDREEHKQIFIREMNSKLKNLDINYKILFVEQTFDKSFNRGKLLNCGFDYLKDEYDFFIFHDVDMIPSDISSYYIKEDEKIVHLATNASQFNYNLPYNDYFGGIVMFEKEEFKDVNGYSNSYWGWGAEDDDFLRRCINKNKKIYRRITVIESLSHKSNIFEDDNKTIKKDVEDNRKTFKKFEQSTSFGKDGLSNLSYDILNKITLSSNTEIIKVVI